MRLAEHPLDMPLRDALAPPPGDPVRLYWTGQAGFVVEGGGRRVVIDPYLSDWLACRCDLLHAVAARTDRAYGLGPRQAD